MSAREQTDTKLSITYPGRYNVILVNDDITPMEFVIDLLVTIFNKNIEQSTKLTLAVHNDGKAVAGTYSSEVAEQKQFEAMTATRNAGWPLEVLVEGM